MSAKDSYAKLTKLIDVSYYIGKAAAKEIEEALSSTGKTAVVPMKKVTTPKAK